MKRINAWWIIVLSAVLAGCQLMPSGAAPQNGPAVLPSSTRGPAAAPATSAAPQPSSSGFSKYEVKNASARQAVCNDGTPPVYYVRRGSGTDAAKWLIFFQGGGYCGSDSSCAYRWSAQHDLMTSQGAAPTPLLAGIFSTSTQDNPDFSHFTDVYINYCSSDMYSGDTQRAVAGQQMQFRGHKIVAAILQDLQDPAVLPAPNLKSAAQVLLGGSSAGSFGAASNLDWVAAQLPWATVKGVLDSSWVAPLPDYGSGPLSPQPGSAAFYSYFSAVVDQSCAAANPSQPQICLSTLQLYPYLSTPAFVYADQRDPTLLQTVGVTDPKDPAQAAYILKYSAALRTSLQNVPAVFSPSIQMHTALVTDRFTSVLIDGHSFAELLGNWYFGRPGPIHLIAGQSP